MGASGKVAPVATLSPKGVHKVVKGGWQFKCDVGRATSWTAVRGLEREELGNA